MRSDREKWDKKYSALSFGSADRADETLELLKSWFNGAGKALDIACGTGANLQWLSSLGYEVTGIDASFVGLKLACQQANANKFHLIAADLEQTSIPAGCYTVIIVIHYLNRALLPAIIKGLKPGGRLFFKTFNRNILDSRPGFNPDFVLETGELPGMFEGLNVCGIGDPDAENPAESWILVQKPEDSDE